MGYLETPETDALAASIGRLGPRINAAMAQLADLAVAFDDSSRWAEVGIRSCAHWLTINLGLDLRTACELVRVGHALASLPLLHAAFGDGRLSFDKARAVTRVAVPEDEEMWLNVVLHASGAQLARICRAVRKCLDAAAAGGERMDEKRSVRSFWRDDGMFELMAVLPPEEGAVVAAALEAAHKEVEAELEASAPGARPRGGTATGLPYHEQIRADSLVRVCESWVAGAAAKPIAAPTTQVVIHVDADELLAPGGGGRCHIEDGPWLSPAALEFLGCDADVIAVTERDGLPIDVGHVRRLISARQRLALHARDKGCRFPGCSVPAKRCHGHHIDYWHPQFGPTTLENLALLCRFHHRGQHKGKFRIRKLADGTLRFETPDGVELQHMAAVPADGELAALDSTTTARALSAGAPCKFEYAVEVLANSAEFRRNAARERAP